MVPAGIGALNWGKWGYKNEAGEWAIPAQYDWAGEFHEGYALVVVKARVHEDTITTKWENTGYDKRRQRGLVLLFDGGRMGVIDKSGRVLMEIPARTDKLLIKEKWAHVNLYDKLAVLRDTVPVFMDGEGYGQYSVESFHFRNGFAVIPMKDRAFQINGGCTYLRASGGTVTRAFPQVFWHCSDFNEGLAKIEVLAASTGFGYIGEDGQWLIPAVYPYASDFSEGLAAVEDRASRLWGAIDKTGSKVIPFQFTRDFTFSEGLAYVEINSPGSQGLVREYIDKSGRRVFTLDFPIKSDVSGRPFHGGLARVEELDGNTHVIRTSFVDGTGRVLFRLRAECIDFQGSVTACWVGDRNKAGGMTGILVFDRNGTIKGKDGASLEMEQDLATSPGILRRDGAQW